MKQVEYVSIGGYMFAVETDACNQVKTYLDELETFYSKKESGAEVMEGIEERMAELFLEKCGNGGVVNAQTVSEVTAVLGRPETIEEESAEDPDEGNDTDHSEQRKDARKDDCPVRKKLYRDTANGRVAGVCSGLGTFFGMDPVIFRIIFVALTILGIGIRWRIGHLGDITFPVIYLILWICMPAAKTVNDRDKMYGTKGTVDEISRRIESGAHEIADTAADFGRSQAGKNLMRFFTVILGFAMFIVGLTGTAATGMVAAGNSFFGTHSFLFNKMMENLSDLNPFWAEVLSDPQVIWAMIAVVAIPFILLLYAGVMLTFGLKEPKWHPGLCLFLLWIVAIVVFICMFLIRFNSIQLFI